MRGMVAHGGHGIPLEMVNTVIEMADVAWNALEHRRERKHEAAAEEETARILSENLRLRNLLADNVALLEALSQTPAISDDCPPDLYKRLVAAVDDAKFQSKLESLHQQSAVVPNYVLSKAKGADFSDVDILVNVDDREPTWWVWVPQGMDPDSLEEVSEIDNENYVIITEETVVDGISNFIAKCILENPKSKVLTPEELRKSMTRALSDIKDRSMLRKIWEAGKVIYFLSTWGIAFAGLYQHRAVLKVAARGVHATGKFVMKAV